jgi:hypothetical protein
MKAAAGRACRAHASRALGLTPEGENANPKNAALIRNIRDFSEGIRSKLETRAFAVFHYASSQ